MTDLMTRRDLLKLAGVGVAVFVSGTTVRAAGRQYKENESFYFVQLSDTHWGFNGSSINPDSHELAASLLEWSTARFGRTESIARGSISSMRS